MAPCSRPPPATAASGGEAAVHEDQNPASRCNFWLPNKRRYCANAPLPSSQFCGNHNPSVSHRRVPCPVDPSHSILKETLESHVKICPLRKQAQTLESQPYYAKGINSGAVGADDDSDASAEEKRKAVYRLTVGGFHDLMNKIATVRSSVSDVLYDSYIVPDACRKWMERQIDRRVPYQDKHVRQQASILGNMEVFGVLPKPDEAAEPELGEGKGIPNGLVEEDGRGSAVVEFGAGRGYLTHMLADCYGVRKIFLVERRSYKLKADRNLRQIPNMSLERLRIDNDARVPEELPVPVLTEVEHCTSIEDLNLHAIESLKGFPYTAIGKHLCGPATDLALRCCLPEESNENKKIRLNTGYMQGLAIATCCHHLCQWKHYINKKFLLKWGITKEDFNAITWFSSWAVDGHHSSELSHVTDQEIILITGAAEQFDVKGEGIEEIIRNMPAVDRAILGFRCKEVIDIGRLLWLREDGMDSHLVKYVPSNISPENHLLLTACNFNM